MALASLNADEREVVRRAMQATFRYFDADFHTRLGVHPETMCSLLAAWPTIDDADDDSDAFLAINNSLNDLLHGVGISENEALELLGVSRKEAEQIYARWVADRGWKNSGVR